jgi:hypothetical protein
MCPICYNTASTFEANNKNFRKHIVDEHTIWKYLDYIIYLRNKNEEDYDGLEGNINQAIENRSFDWIPTQSTLYYTPKPEAKENLQPLLQKTLDMFESLDVRDYARDKYWK